MLASKWFCVPVVRDRVSELSDEGQIMRQAKQKKDTEEEREQKEQNGERIESSKWMSVRVWRAGVWIAYGP